MRVSLDHRQRLMLQVVDELHAILHHRIAALVDGVLAEDHHLLHDPGHLHAVARELHLLVLHKDGGVHDVAHHVQEPRGAAVDQLQGLLARRLDVGRGRHGAAEADDAVQRRLQLVADHGHEAGLLLLDLLDVRDVLAHADDAHDVALAAEPRGGVQEQDHGLLVRPGRELHLEVGAGVALARVLQRLGHLGAGALGDVRRQLPAPDLVLGEA
mmetsp:Transcript_30323/g.93152  ORF Transcript_30323/g.93152 Transcript_30323/m.93152 type:complete len:213 (-) Transcript_30323:70-708(-)